MHSCFVAASLGAALVFSPVTRAGETAATPRPSMTSAAICAEVPGDQFRPEAQLRGVVENFLRYRISRVGIDGGCYAVLASDRNGTPFEVRFRGDDLRMVSRYVVKDAPSNTVSSSQ